MRIIQLTDLHVPPDGVPTKFGIDTRANFLKLLPEAAALKPDLLVLSGDLCYDVADAPTYDWIRRQLDALGLRYAVIAGNHDDSPLLGSAFGLEAYGNEVYFAETVQGHRLLFLDSAVATVSDAQLEWLSRQLAEIRGPVFIFMHHPPFAAGVPFMDNTWPFRRSADLLAVLTRTAEPVYVFCGHYHTERVVYDGNIRVHLTPSLYFQLDPAYADVVVEHTRSAFRVIDYAEERLITFVRYFD
jgi:Icc protein